jgi:hypothetical protein
MNQQSKIVNMSASNAAEYLGVTTNLLGVWRFRKIHLPFEKIGKSIKYRFDDLETFKESCQRAIKNGN